MRDSRNFVLLSEKKGECLPNVIKEAMINCCYILSGNSDCIQELIPNEKVGIIVNRFDHQKIVKTLKILLSNKTAQDVKFQQSLIRQKFDIQSSTEKYLLEWGKFYEK